MQNEFSRPKATDQIDKNGGVHELSATPKECEALAKRFDCESIRNLNASVRIKPKTDRMTFHVTGKVTAEITQTCIISDKPIQTNLHEQFEAWYRDVSRVTPFRQKTMPDMDENEEHEIRPEEEDPETIRNGVLDMGEVVAQFFGLAIDPYPKAEDVGDKDYIETKPSDKPNPFAKLASLKTKE